MLETSVFSSESYCNEAISKLGSLTAGAIVCLGVPKSLQLGMSIYRSIFLIGNNAQINFFTLFGYLHAVNY